MIQNSKQLAYGVKMRNTYFVGPRKVTGSGNKNVVVYLGKEFQHLIGKKVMLVVKVLDFEESENKLKT